MDVDLYLASQSPRRQALLQQIGVRFATRIADIDEACQLDEDPEAYVRRLALEKANTVWNQLSKNEVRPVLGADTTVCLNGEILGKPENQQQARGMLQKLSGQRHKVMTGVAIISEKHSVCVNVSEVSFRHLTDDEIDRYLATGEPQGKAGGYAIQGYAASFITELSGSYSGVMGLPLCEVSEMLGVHNVPIWQNEI